MAQPGWVSIHRRIWECEIWVDDEPFDKRSAWIDLLLKANHETKNVVIGSKSVPIERGSLVISQVNLANRWHWGRQKVRAYIKLLEDLNMVETKTTNKFTIIKVLKYEVYQSNLAESQPKKNQRKTNKKTSSNHQATNGQPTDNQQKTTNNNINNVNNVNNDNNVNNTIVDDENEQHQYAESVSMTRKEFKQLVEKIGSVPGAMQCIELLNNYKLANGKKYASDYRAILSWVIKRYNEEQTPRYGMKNDILGAQQEIERRLGEDGSNDEQDFGNIVWDF